MKGNLASWRRFFLFEMSCKEVDTKIPTEGKGIKRKLSLKLKTKEAENEKHRRAHADKNDVI